MICLFGWTHEPCVPTYGVTINLFTRLLVKSQLKCERTYEPCVPTCLLLANHFHNGANPKGQSSMVKVQSQGPYMRMGNQFVYLFTR